MSYHGNKIEQLKQLDGQLNNGGYGSPNEAYINEVLGDLQKAHSFKKGIAGFGQSEPNCAFESHGGGMRNFGEGFAVGESMKHLGAAAKYAELKQFGQPNVCDEFDKIGGAIGKRVEKLGHGIANSVDEFSKCGIANSAEPLGKLGAAEAIIGKKYAELKHGYGESYAQKAMEKNVNTTWDNISNGVMLGIGTALGPVGLPLVLTAEARMMRDALNQRNSYGESHSGSFHKEMIQRQKMLKSWRSIDE